MKLIELNGAINIEQDKKFKNAYTQFGELLNEINKKELPNQIISAINSDIEEINSFAESAKKNQETRKKNAIKNH